ncbi:MAG: aminomethyl-transferring glycine dehydrogenase subunit GcvPB, partial [Thiohalomonadales bacterium]
MLIFDESKPGRSNDSQSPLEPVACIEIPERYLRRSALHLPRVSELQTVRHYTRLSQKNFSIDTHFYPLGSCTMKYNPRACNTFAMLSGFTSRHPFAHESLSQGYLSCIYDLQEILKDVSGMHSISLTPMAGAQGEFTGVAMMRAYHEANNDNQRN